MKRGLKGTIMPRPLYTKRGSRDLPNEEGTESPSYILDEIPLSQSKLDDCIFLGPTSCAQSVTSFFGAAPRVLGLARSSAAALRVRDLGTWKKTPELGLKKEPVGGKG